MITGVEDECDNVAREPILPPEEDEQEDPSANAHGNRPYSLRGLPSGHVASAPYFTDDVKRWRTHDVKAVTEQAAYIPLDFYPLCESPTTFVLFCLASTSNQSVNVCILLFSKLCYSRKAS